MPIQEHEIPVVILLSDGRIQAHEIPVVIIVSDAGDRRVSIANNAIYMDASNEGTTDVLDEYVVYNTNSGLVDDLVELLISDSANTSTDVMVETTTKAISSYKDNITNTLLLALKNSTIDKTILSLYTTNYLQNVKDNTVLSLRVNIGSIPEEEDTFVDVDISGAKYFHCLADIYSSIESHDKSLEADIQQGLGRITKLDTDLFCSTLLNTHLDTSIYSTTISGVYIPTELTTISGRLTNCDVDIYSTKLGLSTGINTDLKIRSLFTGNFFLETDKFTTASSIAWIDIVDYLYPINTDYTYLYVNGTMTSGVYFEDIPNGKRLYYDPLDDFYSDGVTIYSVHTENTIGEVEEKDFYLLYGYDLQLNEVVDWGPNNKVIVRITAQNLAFCPNIAGEAFDFTTADLESVNLACFIQAIEYVDLPIEIMPQSTAFFYGRTYTIRLTNVKDFAGNIMPDLEYTFTIENP